MGQSIWVSLLFVFLISLGITLVYNLSRYLLNRNNTLGDQVRKISHFMTILVALLLSFGVAEIWARYSSLQKDIQNQIVNLKQFYQYIKFLPNTKPIIDKLEQYLKSMVVDEWPALSKNKTSPITRDINNELEDLIYKYSIENPSINVMFNNINDLTDHLNFIIHSSSDSYVIIMLSIIVVLFLGMMWFIHIENFYILFFVDFAVIYSISSVMYFLIDLNNPFDNKSFYITWQGYTDLRNFIIKDQKIIGEG